MINHIANRNKSKNHSSPKIPDDPKYKEILQSLLTESQPQTPVVGPPVSNIIGCGTKARKHRGAGIKTF